MNKKYPRVLNLPKVLVIGALLLCTTSLSAMSVDSLFTQARTAANAGKYSVAMESVDALLAGDSANSDALLLKGLILLWQNRFDESTPFFKKVVAAAPQYHDAWISLVNSFARNNQRTAACSTCMAASAIFTSDTVFTVLSQSVCLPVDTTGPKAAHREAAVIEAHVGAGISLFEQSYNRFPWGTFDCGVGIDRNRWGIETVMRAERRKYGELTRYGGEVEVAPRMKLYRKLSAGLRFSLSPYTLVDSLFASHGIAADISSGLPGGIEVGGGAHLRWYGLAFSHMYSCGIGKYWGHYLTGSRLFMALFERRVFLSGTIEVRRFSSHHENDFRLLSVGMGRVPYEAGTLTRNGYLSFVEGAYRTRVHIGRGYSIVPSVAVAAEQVTRRNEVNVDGVDDLRRSAVRMKTSLMMTVFMKRSVK